MATSDQIEAERALRERLLSLPVDLESTPEEDADDLAAFERGLEQIKRGQYITLEELDRKYPD